MTVAAVIVPADVADALADGVGRAAVRRIVDAAWAGGAMPIVVVVDDADGRVAAVLEGSPAVLAPAADADVGSPTAPPDGAASAYRAGVAAALASVGETSALLLWPGRMTWVDPESVTSLIEAHGRNPGDIVRPGWTHRAGWPVLVPAGSVAELLELAPSDVAAAIASAGHVTAVELGDPGTVLGRETPLDALPAYAGPPAPVGGPSPEWGAAAADAPDPESTAQE